MTFVTFTRLHTFLYIALIASVVSGPLNLYAQDYYYYKGIKITLTARPDKMACVVNAGLMSAPSVKTEIAQALDAGVTIVETGANVFLFNYEEGKPAASLQAMGARLEAISGVKFVTPVYYGDSKRVTQIPTDEIAVRLKDRKYKPNLDALNAAFNCSILTAAGGENGYIIKSNDGVALNALELTREYFDTEIFEYAEPNFLYPEFSLLHSTPNDALYASQWALKNTAQSVTTGGTTNRGDVATANGIVDADMDVDAAWDYATGTGVKVAVFDTGIDSTHPDFAGQLLAGYDAYYDKNSVANDSGNHGTCTAGLIGAVANNSIGIAGIAYNAKIASMRIFNAAGSTTNAACARAFDTARVRGFDILSNSWGGGTAAALLTDAINAAALNGRDGKGCVILFSSGNDGRNPPSYPSYLPNTICVGASTTHDQKKASGTGNQYWWGGNWGEDANGDIELVAPTVCYSVDVQGTKGYNTSAGTAGNYTPTFNGTSCSCPNAAGVAALVLSVNTSFTRAQVWDYIMRGCDKIDNVPYSTDKTYGKWNAYNGYGRINAYNSVRLAAGIDVTPPSINHTQLPSNSSTRGQIVSAEIVDQNGAAVPVSGTNQPKLFFRVNKNGGGWSAYDSLTASSAAGNTFSFTLPCVGWQTEVQYYLRARDNSGNETYFPRGVNNSFPACYFAVCSTMTVSGKNTALTLPTSGSAKSANFTIGNYTILDLKLLAYIRHTYISDALFTVQSPGTDANYNRKCFYSHNGGTGANMTNAAITDSATTYWRQGTAPYTNGTYVPEYPFRGYNGTSANGNWNIIYYDSYAGDGGTCDSVVVRLTVPSGTTSPSARLDAPADSTINFGTVNGGETSDRNFYLKNAGNSTLTIDSIRFAGTYASKFSVLASPASIAAGDSGLFTVRCNNGIAKAGVTNGIEGVQSAVMNVYNNDPSKTNFKVSLETENTLPVELVSFSGLPSAQGVELKWLTKTETNFYGWDVERARIEDNNATPLEWEKAGSVKAAGNSNSEKEYFFTDKLTAAGTYSYRLKQIESDGTFSFSPVVTVEFTVPAEYALFQNYPNPFNPVTKIRYHVGSGQQGVSGPQAVRLRVMDVLGSEVALLVKEPQAAGAYEIEFNASALPSGTYFYELRAGEFKEVKKMLLLR